MSESFLEKFNLTGKVAIITGGAGLLGVKHAEVISELGGIPVLLDINSNSLEKAKLMLGSNVYSYVVDITDESSIKNALNSILKKFKKVDILINNAANNPTMTSEDENIENSRIENFPLIQWEKDLSVGLTGAFLCSKIFGLEMANNNSGVILNIASDLGVIAPDQRIYRKEGLPEEKQPVKPVTYSVVKSGIIGLTRYLSTYWNKQGLRVNALVPGGVYTNQDEEFIAKLSNLIPLGRMAEDHEYQSAIAFLVSEASSYMTGSILVVDGGRTSW